jgi:hypothetical protein
VTGPRDLAPLRRAVSDLSLVGMVRRSPVRSVTDAGAGPLRGGDGSYCFCSDWMQGVGV